MRKVSDSQICKLQVLYRKHFDVNLSFEEAKDIARRLVTMFCPQIDEVHPLRSEKQ